MFRFFLFVTLASDIAFELVFCLHFSALILKIDIWRSTANDWMRIRVLVWDCFTIAEMRWCFNAIYYFVANSKTSNSTTNICYDIGFFYHFLFTQFYIWKMILFFIFLSSFYSVHECIRKLLHFWTEECS